MKVVSFDECTLNILMSLANAKEILKDTNAADILLMVHKACTDTIITLFPNALYIFTTKQS